MSSVLPVCPKGSRSSSSSVLALALALWVQLSHALGSHMEALGAAVLFQLSHAKEKPWVSAFTKLKVSAKIPLLTLAPWSMFLFPVWGWKKSRLGFRHCYIYSFWSALLELIGRLGASFYLCALYCKLLECEFHRRHPAPVSCRERPRPQMVWIQAGCQSNPRGKKKSDIRWNDVFRSRWSMPSGTQMIAIFPLIPPHNRIHDAVLCQRVAAVHGATVIIFAMWCVLEIKWNTFSFRCIVTLFTFYAPMFPWFGLMSWGREEAWVVWAFGLNGHCFYFFHCFLPLTLAADL